MAHGLTQIRCGTASTHELLRLSKYTALDRRYLRTLSLKGKKEEIRLEKKKNESNVKMRKGGVPESSDLSAYLQRMYPCEWKAEVDYSVS